MVYIYPRNSLLRIIGNAVLHNIFHYTITNLFIIVIYIITLENHVYEVYLIM